MEKISEVKIKDLFLASYLICKDFKYSRSPQLENRLVTFYFVKTKELEDACSSYVNHLALVDPLAILEAYRTVKVIGWEIKKREGVQR
jgi:hypothetical protein